jgi:8-oxo-dGTP diphosphatase
VASQVGVSGGKIEAGETPAEAVRREILEETGLQIETPELLGIHTHHWTLPEHTQQTFLIVYRAKASSGEVTLSLEENDLYKWVTLEEYLAMTDHLGANLNMIQEVYVPLHP